MSPQSVAAAASVSPYPFVVRGAVPSPPVDNAESGPHAKGKKARARARVERPPRQEEEPRFNTGPRTLRPPQANRGSRRVFRLPGRTYPEDQNGIPDYPPPSFQEAINTPPVSVCSSTTSLVLAPTPMQLAIPENIPEHEEPIEKDMKNLLNETTASDNASDSDESIFIIDPNSVPICSTDLPKGAELENRIKTDWLRRRGVQFPGKHIGESSSKSNHCPDNQNINRGRIPLEIDSDVKSGPPSPTVSSPKRRFMSLSPLRTIIPRTLAPQGRETLSAHPSASSLYSSSRSVFFRSSSSLATTSFLGLPLLSSSNGKTETLTRKFFKGKERAKDPENIDVWEVLGEDSYAGVDQQGNEKLENTHPRSLLSAVESLQVASNHSRSQSFTFGSQVGDNSRTKQSLIPPQEVGQNEHQRHSLVTPPITQETVIVRDWKGPSTPFIDRPINRSRSPASNIPETSGTSTSNLASPISTTVELSPGPPLTTVRVRARSPPPLKQPSQVAHPSPLRVIIDNESAAAAAIYQQALDTPLPTTPDFYDHGGSVVAKRLDDKMDYPPWAAAAGARLVPGSLADSISALELVRTPKIAAQTSAAVLSIPVDPNANLAAPNSMVKTSSLEEPMTPMRRHYIGRPLPRPPPSTNHSGTARMGSIDSTYAAPEDSGHAAADSSFSSCREGMLIDLDDTTLDDIHASGTSTPRSDEERFRSQGHLPILGASSSSVDLFVETPSALTFNSMRATSTPLRSTSPANHPSTQGSMLSELTDLDMLVSRLANGESNGSNYEMGSGTEGWKQPALNKYLDTPPGRRATWSREPIPHIVLPNSSRNPHHLENQRQYVAHWAY